MPLTALACPHCGAPVAPRLGGTVTCAYCLRTLVGVPAVAWAALLDARDDEAGLDGSVTARVGEVLYAVQGLLRRGARSDLLLATRVRRPTARVVLKVLRAERGAGLRAARGEHALLTRLAFDEARGSGTLFSTLVPQPVAVGALVSRDLPERAALVYRWRSGFEHSLVDVRAAYPGGIDGRAATWMWRRVLAMLAWVHAAGLTHGAVLPEHVLVHPRDHGAVLLGWSKAGTGDAATDVAMSARAILCVATAEALPEPLGALVQRVAAGASGRDARTLSADVLAAATVAYGPPAFHPFTMPGSSSAGL